MGVHAQAYSQGTNCARTFADGSPRRIHLLTITLPAVPITSKWPNGFFMEVSSLNGNPMLLFYGSMGNVRSPDFQRDGS